MTPILTDVELDRCMAERMSVAEMEKRFRLSKEAIYSAISRLYLYNNPHAAHYAAELTAQSYDVVFTNRRQSQMISDLLTQKMAETHRFEERQAEILHILEHTGEAQLLPPNIIKAIETLLLSPKDPATVATRASAELRALSDQYIAIQNAMYQHDTLGILSNGYDQILTMADSMPLEIGRPLRQYVEGIFMRVLSQRTYLADEPKPGKPRPLSIGEEQPAPPDPPDPPKAREKRALADLPALDFGDESP
jgi:hypothetical protein